MMYIPTEINNYNRSSLLSNKKCFSVLGAYYIQVLNLLGLGHMTLAHCADCAHEFFKATPIAAFSTIALEATRTKRPDHMTRQLVGLRCVDIRLCTHQSMGSLHGRKSAFNGLIENVIQVNDVLPSSDQCHYVCSTISADLYFNRTALIRHM